MDHDPIHIGIIGGSGLYQMEGLEDVHEIRVTTPFGDPSDALVAGRIEGVPVAFLPRHGRGHVHTPTEVPYRANIHALKQLGVEKVISISACGSLREPFCPVLSTLLFDAVAAAGGTVHRGGTMITIEGPRFSTKGESLVFRQWGMDVIGMTASPEAFLAREAGMCYATMAHITDYDVWHESEEPVTVEMVIQVLHHNVGLAQQSIRLLVPHLVEPSTNCACAHALDTAIITARESISAAALDKRRLLVGAYLE
jgi:5'-methylthioadenosine phosphorylase